MPAPIQTLRDLARGALRRHGGLMLAAVVALTVVGLNYRLHHTPARGYTVSSLPGFDAYVYLAMAEQPRVFTVAPWGYRILAPWLARLASPDRPLRGFRWVTLATTILAATLLFLFLRRLGLPSLAALVGVVLFCLSPPVGELLGNPFSTEGPGVALEMALLLAIAARAPALGGLLLLALALLTKDFFLLFVPLLYLLFRPGARRGRAVVATLAVGLAAVLFQVGLRLYWTPQIHTPRPIFDGRLLELIWSDARLSGRSAALASLLGGLLPLALLGSLRKAARPWLARYGYLLVATLALPFVAWFNVPDRRPFGFFGDVPRLHIYALPFLIPLALLAVGRVFPSFDPAPTDGVRRRRGGWVTLLLASALVGVVAFPFLAADRYRRHPLHARREGPQALLTCRRTLLAADQLEHGQTVVLPVGAAGSSSPDATATRRWYLADGWDDDTYLALVPLTLSTARASVLLPSQEPRDLDVALRAHAAQPVVLGVEVNGRAVGAAQVGVSSEEQAVRIPAALLFRGDNLLTFTRAAESAPVTFDAVHLRPSGPPEPLSRRER